MIAIISVTTLIVVGAVILFFVKRSRKQQCCKQKPEPINENHFFEMRSKGNRTWVTFSNELWDIINDCYWFHLKDDKTINFIRKIDDFKHLKTSTLRRTMNNKIWREMFGKQGKIQCQIISNTDENIIIKVL